MFPDNTWVIFCRGSSIKNMIPQLQEHFKSCKNSIAVNSAANTFKTEYWLILDAQTYYGNPNIRERKLITSRICAGRIRNHFKNAEIFYISDSVPSNSGIFAIDYALQQGAERIITCGFELTDTWNYFDGKGRLSKSYAALMRDSFLRSSRRKKKIYSVDRNNPLKLKFYDIEKGEFHD